MTDDAKQRKERLSRDAALDLEQAKEHIRSTGARPQSSGMIPAPNVVAGILIGVINDSWLTVLGIAALWPFVFCIYVSVVDRSRRDATITSIAERGRHLLLGSPVLTFYAIEFATALSTAMFIALVSHGVKRLLS